MGVHHLVDLGRVVVPLVEVLGVVGGLVRQADEAVQHADLRVERAVERLRRRLAVEAGDQSLAEPLLLRQRVALGALLDLDVLPLQAEVGNDT